MRKIKESGCWLRQPNTLVPYQRTAKPDLANHFYFVKLITIHCYPHSFLNNYSFGEIAFKS